MRGLRNVVVGLLYAGALSAAGLATPGRARAAFPAETLEGLGPDRDAPEVHVGARFDQDFRRATITREFVQNARTDPSFEAVRELE